MCPLTRTFQYFVEMLVHKRVIKARIAVGLRFLAQMNPQVVFWEVRNETIDRFQVRVHCRHQCLVLGSRQNSKASLADAPMIDKRFDSYQPVRVCESVLETPGSVQGLQQNTPGLGSFGLKTRTV